MQIKLKLVGSSEECFIDIDKTELTLSDIYNYLIENNLSYDEVSKMMFIHNGEHISNIINIIDEQITIHIFIKDIDIKNELIKNIFNADSIESYSDSFEVDNKKNDEIIKLFSDNDFTYILKLCIDKPDLINTVLNYLLNGNITTEINKIKNEEFKYNDMYVHLVELLNKLNINKDENELKSIIQHFEGNLNLSLRYVLCTNNLGKL
jgi:hypothetical protein